MSNRALPRLLVSTALLAATPAHATVGSNTAFPMPGNLQLADADGDGIDDWVIVDGALVIVAEVDFAPVGMGYGKLGGAPHHMWSGHFTSTTRDDICGAYGRKVQCVRLDGRTLTQVSIQKSFVDASDRVIVGDFDGNGVDDLLVHKLSAATAELWTVGASGFERADATRFSLGDLEGQLASRTLLAGNFLDHGGEGTRSDLLVIDDRNGTATRYDARRSGNGTRFERIWIVAAGFATGKQVLLANVRGTAYDQIVTRDPASSQTRFYEPILASSGVLTPITQNVDELGAHPGASAFLADLANRTSSADKLRDDVLLFDPADQTVTAVTGRTTSGVRHYSFAWRQAMFDLAADQDGDAIKTRDELGAYDWNKDGVCDADLAVFGASPFVKDVFVEVDYMVEPPSRPGAASRSLAPSVEVRNLAIREMAKKGINLHIALGEEVPWDPYLGNGAFDWETHFDPIKNAHFTPERWLFFHYAVFANRFSAKHNSGISRDIPSSDFLVTLGSWGTNGESVEQVTGTFLHELGHNLGLLHGGTDSTNNKPNDLSIMNYSFQGVGVKKDGEAQFLYSEQSCGDLDELHFDERTGVRCTGSSASYETYVSSMAAWVPTNKRVDCNGDGEYGRSNSVPSTYCDLNGDLNAAGQPYYGTLAGGRDEYASLVFGGGLIGFALPLWEADSSGAPRPGRPSQHARQRLGHKPPTDELDLQREVELRKHRPRLKALDLRKLRDKIETLQLLAPDAVQIHHGVVRFDPSAIPPRKRKAAARILRPARP